MEMGARFEKSGGIHGAFMDGLEEALVAYIESSESSPTTANIKVFLAGFHLESNVRVMSVPSRYNSLSKKDLMERAIALTYKRQYERELEAIAKAPIK